MYLPQKTTLVLGAGASCSYGFPVGSGLRRKILAMETLSNAPSFLRANPQKAKEFLSAFRDSQMYSIDAFLARRTEFQDVGKAAIASVLLACETRSKLLTEEGHKDHWYQYLVNRLSVWPWENLPFGWLSIITFNYDRSLEAFLCSALCSIYAKAEAEVVERLKDLTIVHVYGSLGDPWDGGSAEYVPYGPPLDDLASWVGKAAASINVVPEGRREPIDIPKLHDLLRKAKRICFLGFGFDTTNLHRLGAPGFYDDNKQIVGTALDLTDGEIQQFVQQIAHGQPTNLHTGFHQDNCISVLRRTLVLG